MGMEQVPVRRVSAVKRGYLVTAGRWLIHGAAGVLVVLLLVWAIVVEVIRDRSISRQSQLSNSPHSSSNHKQQ
jgi:hypothetical protein